VTQENALEIKINNK